MTTLVLLHVGTGCMQEDEPSDQTLLVSIPRRTMSSRKRQMPGAASDSKVPISSATASEIIFGKKIHPPRSFEENEYEAGMGVAVTASGYLPETNLRVARAA